MQSGDHRESQAKEMIEQCLGSKFKHFSKMKEALITQNGGRYLRQTSQLNETLVSTDIFFSIIDNFSLKFHSPSTTYTHTS